MLPTNQLSREDLHFLQSLGRDLKQQDTKATRKPVVFRLFSRERRLYVDPSKYDKCVLVGDHHSNLDFIECHNEGKAVEEIKKLLLSTYHFEEDEVSLLQTIEDLKELCENEHLIFEVTGYTYFEKYENYFLTETGVLDYIDQNNHKLGDHTSFIIEHAQSYELERLLEIVEKFAESDES